MTETAIAVLITLVVIAAVMGLLVCLYLLFIVFVTGAMGDPAIYLEDDKENLPRRG